MSFGPFQWCRKFYFNFGHHVFQNETKQNQGEEQNFLNQSYNKVTAWNHYSHRLFILLYEIISYYSHQ